MKILIFIPLLSFFVSCSQTPQNNSSQNNEKAIHDPTNAISSSVLNAPGTYVKNTISAVGQAKEAAALMEKTQQERLKSASGE